VRMSQWLARALRAGCKRYCLLSFCVLLTACGQGHDQAGGVVVTSSEAALVLDWDRRDEYVDAGLLIDLSPSLAGSVPIRRLAWQQLAGPPVLWQEPDQLNTQVMMPRVNVATAVVLALQLERVSGEVERFQKSY
jgi:hypothetical protein